MTLGDYSPAVATDPDFNEFPLSTLAFRVACAKLC